MTTENANWPKVIPTKPQSLVDAEQNFLRLTTHVGRMRQAIDTLPAEHQQHRERLEQEYLSLLAEMREASEVYFGQRKGFRETCGLPPMPTPSPKS